MSKDMKIGKLAIFNIYCSDDLEEKLFEIDGRIDQVERISSQYFSDSDLKIDINRLNIKMSDLQEQIKKITAASEKKGADKIIVNSNEEVARLENKVKGLEVELETLKRQKTAPASDKGKFEKYDDLINALATCVKKQEVKINDLTKQLEAALAETKKQSEHISALEKALNSVPAEKPAPAAPKRKKAPDTAVLKSNSKKVFITEKTSGNELKQYIEKTLDVSEMEKAVGTSGLDEKDNNTYSKLINQYKSDLVKGFEKLKLDELESGEISSAVIGVVGKAVSRTITDKIVTSVSDRIKRGKTNYSSLLDAVNTYLESIGFYSEIIKTGEKITDRNNSIHMNTVYTPTSDSRLHGVIYEIQSLPYLINFIDEDENPDVYVCKGSCAVYRVE